MLWARKLIYRLYRVVTSVHHHGRRRLTRAGLAVAAGFFVSMMLGLDISGSLAYQAFTLLFTLLTVSFVGVGFFRASFHAERRLPRFGTVGQPVFYRVAVRNDTPRVQAGLLLLENIEDPRPGFEEFVALQLAEEKRMRSFSVVRKRLRWNFELARVKEAPIPTLQPGETADVSLELTPVRRGHVRFQGVTVARPDPFGLIKSFARLALPQTLLVLPKRYPLPPIALPGTMKYQQGGVAMASSVGESEEFVSLREYRPGDPLRHIHWRTWARVGKPVVKEFQDEFFVRHALILDTFVDHPSSDAFEEAISVAASFACTIQTQESLLDLLFVGPEAYCFTSGRGLAHTEQMLEILAAVRVCRARGFDALEQLVLKHAGLVSGCICVFLAWDTRRQDLIQKLKILGLPLLVLVVTEPGGPQLDPGPLRDQPECFRVLECGKVAEGLARL